MRSCVRRDSFTWTRRSWFTAGKNRHVLLPEPPPAFREEFVSIDVGGVFPGKKELFAGLALERLEKDWAEHPVLHLDLNTQQYNTTENLSTKLNRELVEWEKLYGAEAAEVSLSMRFEGVIRRACERTGQRVAILVDEYDKPMLQAIGNKELQQAFRDILKAFLRGA